MVVEMSKLPPVPHIPDSERTPLVDALVQQIAFLREVIHSQQQEVDLLKQEVARLKKHNGKPKIGPSALERPRRKRRKKKNRGGASSKRKEVDDTVVVKAPDVPEGSRFKGYADFTVQELVIETRTTRYRLEKWQTPEGQMVTAPLPAGVHIGHFGPTLVSFVLYQHYHAQVTEPLIVEQLREWGVEISTGQLHRLLVQGKQRFHEEKDEILRVGLQVSRHIHVDDTGARHQGKNGVCTHIGNEVFAWFSSTQSKSRINFLQLLRAGRTDYVLSGEALEYMAAQKMPTSVLKRLAQAQGRQYPDESAWQQGLRELGIHKSRHVRIATEGALLGSVLEHSIHPQLAIISDDAGQFNILVHALCWIHAERNLAKLIGFNDEQRAALQQVRTELWQLYSDLKLFKRGVKLFKEASFLEDKQQLSERFDTLCDKKTCFVSLNLALKRMKKNKSELMLVLERPDLPLHNNLSEGDIREYVKKRKISGPTRSEAGRRGRDTFASLKKTCRKLGVSFWSYLLDRTRGEDRVPALPALIEARAQAP